MICKFALSWGRYLPALAFVAILAGLSLYADRQRENYTLGQEREAVRRSADTLRARLEGELNGALATARGMVAMIAAEPEMDQARFAWLASHTMEPQSPLRNVVGARDLVANLVYPLEGNRAVLGLDYLHTPAQRKLVLAMRDSGTFVLAGPRELVQGGQGLIGRFPVFAELSGSHEFWGMLSVVIDPDRLYATAGLLAPGSGLSVALAGRDGQGVAGDVFFGSRAVLRQNPVALDVLFPNGSWRLYAMPQDGWGSTVNLVPFRALLLTVFLSGAALAGLLNYSWVQRYQTIAALRRRERELEAVRGALETQAMHDYLTGLPNRRALDTQLAQAEAAQFAGVLLLDLDRFKEVNDLAGHTTGDFVLRQVAERLRAAVGEWGILGRSEGDEFVILCRGEAGQNNRARLERLAKRVVSAMRAPFRSGKRVFRIGVSVGICERGAGQASSAESCAAQADHALSAAKALGRNRYVFAPQERQAGAESRVSATELLDALAQGGFVPFYQPQFARDGRAVVGVEALARWQHPRLGLLSPNDFIPLARVLKVEGELDQCMLERVMRDFAIWERDGLPVPKVSVNVSAQRINDADLIAQVDAVLAKVGGARGRLTFELLESIFLDDPSARVTHNIAALKARGIQLEIDDFGTGHSSVTSLLRLRPRGFKIDRSLVQAAAETQENRQLLGAIAAMGAALMIEVTAEGVETEAQLKMASAIGCHAVQGYCLARPMPMAEFAAFLRRAHAEGALDRAAAPSPEAQFAPL